MKKLSFRVRVCTLTAVFCLVPAVGACESYAPNDTDNRETVETLPAPPAPEEPAIPPLTEEPPAPEEPITPPAQEPPEPDVPAVKPEPPKPAQAQYILIKTDDLNFRSGAGTTYASLGKAKDGTLFYYGGKTGEWYKTYYRGKTAYISAKSGHSALVSMEIGTKSAEAVIEEGLKLLGTTYVYGATRLHDGKGTLLKNFTASKFDCSSLTQYIFYQGAGVLLGTTTRTQVLQGKAAQKADLKRGDLLFFTNSSRVDRTGIERIGHVALYLGDNYILHTASDYAKIEQITAQRWSYYITARRML